MKHSEPRKVSKGGWCCSQTLCCGLAAHLTLNRTDTALFCLCHRGHTHTCEYMRAHTHTHTHANTHTCEHTHTHTHTCEHTYPQHDLSHLGHSMRNLLKSPSTQSLHCQHRVSQHQKRCCCSQARCSLWRWYQKCSLFLLTRKLSVLTSPCRVCLQCTPWSARTTCARITFVS